MNVPFRRYWGLLVNYLRPQWPRAVLLALLLTGSIGLQLIEPQIVRYFIDTATSGSVPETLTGAALLFIGVSLVQQVVAVLATYTGENVGWTATNALRADLTLHCLRLDMSFHKRRTPGELIERIDGDVTELANFFSQFVVRILGNLLLIGAVLLVLFREDWRVGLGLTVYTLLTFAAMGAVQNLGVARWTAIRQVWADFTGFLEERLAGTEDIRSSGAEAYVMRGLYQRMRRMLLTERSAWMMANLTYVITRFLAVAGYTLGLAIGAYLYTQGGVTIGTAFMIVYYIGMLSRPLDNIREQVQDLQHASASINRVEELFALRPQVRESARLALPDGAPSVEFEHVSFEYNEGNGNGLTENGPGSNLVLHDMAFRLEAGKVLGLLGRTGGGKTTLTRLLFRLYDPTAGAIRLDGVDIGQVALAELRRRVGMVTQDVQLFQASIRDNLTFFDEEIGDDEIERALQDLGLWKWVQSLPEGLNTPLAAGGQGLSAGEAQLLAFTRVFLKDPGLVILDEASSRLDPATEYLLERAIDRLLAGRTAIIIAHRLGTVQRADDILILEQGRIAESGPREPLARDPASRFYHLLATGLEEELA